LQDISVTRETQKWGIPSPVDSNQVVYVWFDALINYISADPSRWPADVHIIGKDILRFHAVIWPSMLLSAGYPLPKKIFAHGFFTIDDVKISKSLGNTIDPLKISEKYGVDSLRYYLFKEIPFGNDGDFSFKRLEEVYNADLANGLGNLVARVAKLCEISGLVLKPAKTKPMFDAAYQKALEELRFQEALGLIWSKITNIDRQIDQSKPWKLIKKDTQKSEATLTSLVDEIRAVQGWLIPFLPTTADKIAEQFAGPKIKSANPLFPRIK
jgi:methionyl-tRNA synthetase